MTEDRAARRRAASRRPRCASLGRALLVLLIIVLSLPLGALGASAEELLPTPVITPNQEATGAIEQPGFAFTGAQADTQECTFGLIGSNPDPEPCSGSFSGLTTVDGIYELTVQSFAGADTSPVARSTYIRDATVQATVTTPPSPANDTTPTWGLDLQDDATATCSVDGAAAVPCAEPSFTPVTPLTSGVHHLVVAVTGVLGGTAHVTSASYDLDATAPAAPVVTGMPAAGSSSTGQWGWTVGSGETSTCTLLHDGSPGLSAGCTSPATFSLTSEGSWVLQVVVTDAVGNAGGPGRSAPYLRDTTLPGTPSVSSNPVSPGNSAAPAWVVTLPGDGDLQCQLVSADSTVLVPWATVAGTTCTADLAGRPDGAYVMQLRSRDAAGNVSNPASGATAYLYDTSAPTAPTVTASRTTGSGRTPSFAIAVESGVSAQCRLVRPGEPIPDPASSVGFSACTLPSEVLSLGGAPDGSFLLQVRAVDTAGNASSLSSAAYLLDTVPPVAPTVTGASAGRVRAAMFHVEHAADSVLTCQLTGGNLPATPTPAPCGPDPSFDLTGAIDGSYVMTAFATDEAGNVSSSAKAYQLDTTAPTVSLTAQQGTFSSADHWSWTWFEEIGSTSTCQLTGPLGVVVPPSACSSGWSADLLGRPDGDYTFELIETDAVGNPTTASVTTTLDRSLPSLDIVAPDATAGLNPIWVINTNGDHSTLSCTLDVPGGPSVPYPTCPGTLSVTIQAGAPQGEYVLHVQVSSLAGRTAFADSPYELDTVPPVLTVDLGLTPTAGPLPNWSVMVAGTLRSTTCRIVAAPDILGVVPVDAPSQPCSWSGGQVLSASGTPLSFVNDGRYLLLLEAVDRAGNLTAGTVSAPTGTWILDRVAPPLPSLVAPLPPTGPGQATSVTWNLRPPVYASTRTDCKLLAPGQAVQTVTCVADSYTAALSAEGRYVLEVTRTDAAGNVSETASFDYTRDITPPAVPLVSQNGAALGNTRSSTWTFSGGELRGSYTCTLTSPNPNGTGVDAYTLPAPVPCASGGYALVLGSTAPDGTYTLNVAAVDEAGNQSGSVPGRYTLDSTPYAAPTITGGPEGVSKEPQVEWTFDHAVGSRPVCELAAADGSWTGSREACSSPFARNLERLHGEGAYVLRVWVDDDLGNRSAPATSVTYRYAKGEEFGGLVWASYPGMDLPAPAQPVGEQGERQYAQVNAPFVFTGPVGLALTCELRRGPALNDIQPALVQAPAPCPTAPNGVTTYQVNSPVDGAYELLVSAVRNGVLTPQARRSFVLDRLPPTAPLILTGSGSGGTATNTWTWASDEPQLVALCRLIRTGAAAGPEFACPGGSYTAALGTPGTYLLSVRLIDKAGWPGPTSESSSYVYSPTLPATPRVSLSPASFGRVGKTPPVLTWSFPIQSGVEATCTLRRSGLVVDGPRPCPNGAYTLAMAGQLPGVYSLLVTFGNTGGTSSSAVDYLLSPPDGAPSGASSGAGRSSGGNVTPAAPKPPAAKGLLSAILPSLPAVLSADPVPVLKGIADPRKVDVPLLPGQIANSLVPALSQVVGRPALPLALLSVVMIFLLVQNRIDRRDPKLAAAPTEGEADLTFGPVYRPGPPAGTAT